MTASGRRSPGAAKTDATNLGPARLLCGDAIIVVLLLNEARHRVVSRVFGVSRDDSNLVTAVTIGSGGHALHHQAARVRSLPARPSLFDTAVGAAVLNETVQRIAGDASRDTPAFSSLVAFALLDRGFGPTLRASFRDAQRSLHGLVAGLRRLRVSVGRYGA